MNLHREKVIGKSKLDCEWRKYKEQTHLNISQHILRHIYATMLYNVKFAQRLLGQRIFQYP